VVLNRRRDAPARTIQTLNTIPKHRKAIFNYECTIRQSCQLQNGVSLFKENAYYLEKPVVHNSPQLLILTGMYSKYMCIFGPYLWMVLLISTCTWTYCKTGSFRKWKHRNIKNDV